MLETTKAPWRTDEVDALNATQRNGIIHPFTCPNRGNGTHVNHNGDLGALTATENGWICLSCGYKQDWAYEMMLNPLDPFGPIWPEHLTRPKHSGNL